MPIKLQSLKEVFSLDIPWEIDFRNASTKTEVQMYSTKKACNVGFSSLALVLSLWIGVHFSKSYSLEKTLKEVQNYVSSNETRHLNLLNLNKSFHEERNLITSLINTFSDKFDIQKFLQDLIQQKSEKIKFYEIFVQKEKKDIKQKKIHLTVRLNGSVRKEISLVESLKDDLPKYPSLNQIPNCKSFFQFDNNLKGLQAEEIKFQLTLQSNG